MKNIDNINEKKKKIEKKMEKDSKRMAEKRKQNN